MTYYCLCWRWQPPVRHNGLTPCQFTILKYDQELTWEFLESERQQLFPDPKPIKVQIIQLDEHEGNALWDIPPQELAKRAVAPEFIQYFNTKYLICGVRHFFPTI